MKNFTEFTQAMTPLASEAWDWVIRLDADEPMTAREKEHFIAWLARSPAHIEEIRKINEFWADTLLTELAHSAKVRAEQEKSKAANKGKANGKKISLPLFSHPLYGAAFAIILSVFGGLFWLLDKPAQLMVQAQIYQTDIGQQQQIVLADGTQVTLNADSTLKVSYRESSRNIWLLRGTAHFQVKKNQQKPFNVYVENSRVQAVGTAFTVDLSQKGNINVLVTEGRIALAVLADSAEHVMQAKLNDLFSSTSPVAQLVQQPTTAVTLLEDIAYMDVGEYLTFAAELKGGEASQVINKSIRQLSATDIENKQAWRHGELVFTGETLKNVVAQLKHYSPLTIDIADPQLESLKIGGRFTIDRLDLLFTNLEVNFGVEIQQVDDNKIKIIKKETR